MKTARQCFTPAARAAAAAARARRAQERAAHQDRIDVFVVRRGTRFSWEVRQFGGVVLACGTNCYETRAAALAAGEADWQAIARPDTSRVSHRGDLHVAARPPE